MLRRVLAASRYLVVIAVIGSFLASVLVLIYGALTVVSIMLEVVAHPSFTTEGAKHLAVECIEVIDLFLLSTVLYIVALGLYELFIEDSLPMPSWLVITSLDDLKSKLIGVIVVLLAVTFLANVVDWDHTTTIVALGVAVGLVLLALGYLINLGSKARSTIKQDKTNSD